MATALTDINKDKGTNQSSSSQLHNKDLLDTFLLEMWETLAQIETLTPKLKQDFNENLQDYADTFHKIKGTAALYQFRQISNLASLIERFCEMKPQLTKKGQEKFFSFIEQTTICLRSAFEKISEQGNEANIGLQLTELGGTKFLREVLNNASFSTTAVVKDIGNLPFIEELKLYGQKEQETLEYFVPEIREHLESLEHTLFALKNEEFDEKEAIDQLFRAAHTVKGAAYMVELNPLGDLAHTLEELMVQVRDEGRPFDGKVKQILEEGTRALGLTIETTLGEDIDLLAPLSKLKVELIELLNDPTILPFIPDAVISPEQTVNESTAQKENAFTALLKMLKTYGQTEQETLEYFLPEAREHTENIDLALQALVNPDANLENSSEGNNFERYSEQLFRAAHTLKGAAYMVELESVAAVSHGVEELAEKIQAEKSISDELSQYLFEGSSALKIMLDTIEGKIANESELELLLRNFQAALEDLLDEPPQFLKLELDTKETEVASTQQQVQAQQSSQRRSTATIRVSVDKLDRLLNLVGDLINSRGRLNNWVDQFSDLSSSLEGNRTRLERVTQEFEAQYLNPQLTAETTEKIKETTQNQSQLATTVSERFAELEFDTYNDLNILARSISEMANDISEMQRQINHLKQGLTTELEGLQTISRSIRTQVSRVRMVPIGQLFSRLSRLLRQGEDVYRDKDFILEVAGENAEIDNAILESLAEPLLHLVKNSLIHGIESKEVRLKKGKNPQGTLKLTATYRGNSVTIMIEDDGAGINTEALKKKALDRGVLTATELEALTYQETMELIFLAGLSTAEQVTTEAGRGVGMDAVASTVRELKGNISLTSIPDKGTSFVLTLPLTLVISEVLLCKVATETMAFPIEAIYALQNLSPEKHEDGYYINYEGQELPIYSLQELLALDSNYFENKKEVSVLLLRTGKELLAVAIDEFLALEEVVIKPLNSFLRQLYYLSGVTTISTGQVVLLLNATGLQSLTQATRIEHKTITPEKPKTQTKQRLLLVDDSLSVRKVLSKKLGRLGFDTVSASDGQEALDILLGDTNFDAVLTDLEMPRLNGYELVEAVRRRGETSKLPIIVMTTRARQEHMNLAFELGANDYLTKPVDEAKLMKRLEEYL